MIKSKQDLNYYIQRDRQHQSQKNPVVKFLFPDKIAVFLTTLRRTEYYHNTASKSPANKLMSFYYKWLLSKRSLKLGFSIPINTCGPGLSLPHYGTIVVNAATRIGENCRMHVCVNIGASGGSSKAPQIGNNVYIAPGCKIFGEITIADNVTMSANSVVNKSILQPNVMIGGVPAKILKEYDDDSSFNWKKDN